VIGPKDVLQEEQRDGDGALKCNEDSGDLPFFVSKVAGLKEIGRAHV